MLSKEESVARGWEACMLGILNDNLEMYLGGIARILAAFVQRDKEINSETTNFEVLVDEIQRPIALVGRLLLDLMLENPKSRAELIGSLQHQRLHDELELRVAEREIANV